MHQYAYPTNTDKKYTVSDIVAVNDHVENGKPNPNQFFVFAFGDDNLQAAFGDAAHAELTLEPQIFDKK